MRPLLLCSAIAMAFSPLASAEVILTPNIGYTFGGDVTDLQGNDYDIKGSESFGIALETTVDKGRVGLFYSGQSSDVETVNKSASMHYLHFQSSIYYPASDNLSSFLGVGLGVSYVDADWVDDNVGFSGSIFAGLEYKLSNNLAIQGQLRWLGTVVDNDTSGQCTLPSTDECRIQFDTDWMNQVQTNLGVTYRF